ncbi:MAG: hypothetical protein M9924_20740 [Rhizobiaceae bacterium]|nr:hypothetical protein [Rhizobiaceae bacterium]
MEYAQIPAGGAIVEEMLPLGALFGECIPAEHALAALILDGEFPVARRIAHHRAGSRAATIGGKLDHGWLTAAR